MMKKLILVAAGLMFSTLANATAIGFGASRTITATNCPALDNDVEVQLSKDVKAAYNCDATSFVAAACHANGTNKTQTLTCVYITDPNDATQKIPFGGYADISACAGYPVATPPNPTPTASYTGRVAFGAASGGGTVGAVPFPRNECTVVTIKDATADSNLDTGTSTSN